MDTIYVLFLKAPTTFDASLHGNIPKLPNMIHEVLVAKADSALVVEFSAGIMYNQTTLLLLDFERMPTYKRYQYAAIAGNGTTTTTWKSDGGRNCNVFQTCVLSNIKFYVYRVL